MKNNLLFVFLCCSLAANAQFSTGQKLITGRLDLSAAKSSFSTGNESGNGYVSGSLSLLRFTTPTMLKGFGIGYTYYDSHASIRDIYYQNSFSAFYNVTKLQPLVKNFYLTFGGNLTGSYSFGKDGTSSNYSKINGFGAAVSGSLGLLYQLSPRFIISGELSNLLMLQYSHGASNNYSVSLAGVVTASGTERDNSVQLSTGLKGFNLAGFNVGVSYLLK